ncbi:MAG: hypothetical protein ACO1RX_20225 [Candidatus Sericytochromatia bacterium]
MSNLVLNSLVGLIGTWAGIQFPDMPASLQQHRLPDLFLLVRQQAPDYAQVPGIMRQHHYCRNLLLRSTWLSANWIQELLTFEGTAKAFAPVLQQALANHNLTATNLEAKAAQREQLIEQLEILRSMRVQRQWELLKGGVLGFKSELAWEQHNKILNAYTTTLSKIMRGIAGPNETLEVQAVVVGAGYGTPSSDQTTLGNQLGSSKTPDDSVYTGYQTTFLTPFLPGDNNGVETTLATVANKSQFTLTNSAGFSQGDRVVIAGEKRTLQSLVGSAAVLDQPLINLPAVDTPIRQIWAESGLLINGDLVLGTRSRISEGGYDKTDTKGIFVESAVTARIVGA